MNEVSLRRLLTDFVREDEGYGDLTEALTPPREVKAKIVSKQEGVAAGISELKTLFNIYNISCGEQILDGQSIKPGDTLMTLSGDSVNILLVERTALNILSFMSGIATLTKKYVDVAGKVKVAATRKTHPGFRLFEKKAVKLGGGLTHRHGLDDLYILKDNHLTLFEDMALQIKQANLETYHKVEVEAASTQLAIEASEAGADIVMLDNMSPREVKQTVEELEKKNLREKVILEASGGITLDNLEEYCATGVDVVSTSALTQAKGLDVALEFE
jgi:nicotinate-nucleotide pyrophosphorylase (carboxylating)